MQAMIVTAELTNSGIGISEVCSLSGLDMPGLAASTLTFPGGLACHSRNNQLVGGMQCACSQVVSRQNVVRGDDLKVGDTECITCTHYTLLSYGYGAVKLTAIEHVNLWQYTAHV